jgi:Tol biopolymer transport system component
MDVGRKTARRITFGLERYSSINASADGRRLVASVANPAAALWKVPILDRQAGETDVVAFPVAHQRALGVRFSGRAVYYLSSRGLGDGLWRFQDGQATEIWKGSDGSVFEPAAVSPDGRRIALAVRKNGTQRLHIVSADGAENQPLTDSVDVRGSACWSPDGKWVVTGGHDATSAGLFKIPADGGQASRIPAAPGVNPVWSPDGSTIVYQGATVARISPLRAIHPDGSPIELPEIYISNVATSAGALHRFLPHGKGIVYVPGLDAWQDFRLLDLSTGKIKVLARLGHGTSRSFDITPDGKAIVFDR